MNQAIAKRSENIRNVINSLQVIELNLDTLKETFHHAGIRTDRYGAEDVDSIQESIASLLENIPHYLERKLPARKEYFMQLEPFIQEILNRLSKSYFHHSQDNFAKPYIKKIKSIGTEIQKLLLFLKTKKPFEHFTKGEKYNSAITMQIEPIEMHLENLEKYYSLLNKQHPYDTELLAAQERFNSANTLFQIFRQDMTNEPLEKLHMVLSQLGEAYHNLKESEYINYETGIRNETKKIMNRITAIETLLQRE